MHVNVNFKADPKILFGYGISFFILVTSFFSIKFIL